MTGSDRALDTDALKAWPLPDPGGGKDSRGRVVVVGGSRRTPGAVLLAAEAAVRAGAGKPQVATVASVAVAASVALPEALVTDLPETDDGEISRGAAQQILALASDCDALLFGPGLLSPDGARELLAELAAELRCPLVVDALGMAYLTAHPAGLRHLSGRLVLTPNESELAQTLERDEDHVRAHLADSCAELADRTGATVVTGGAQTWVVSPGDDVRWHHEGGLPGLGVAGSGDVKAGVVAGLLARGLSPHGAAAWAVLLHGGAGDAVSRNLAPLGFLAREVLPWVPRVMQELSESVR